MAEFGSVAPKGPASLKLLEQALAEPDVDLLGPSMNGSRIQFKVPRQLSTLRPARASATNCFLNSVGYRVLVVGMKYPLLYQVKNAQQVEKLQDNV